MERPDAQQRAKWVERWKDSGLTAKELVAEAGFKASDRLEQPAQSRRTRSGKREKRPVTQPPSFVELPLADVTSASVMLELLLGNVRVRVPTDFDNDDFRAPREAGSREPENVRMTSKLTLQVAGGLPVRVERASDAAQSGWLGTPSKSCSAGPTLCMPSTLVARCGANTAR